MRHRLQYPSSWQSTRTNHLSIKLFTLLLSVYVRRYQIVSSLHVMLLMAILFQSEEHQVVSTMICALTAELATFVEGMSSLSCLRYALRSSAVNKLTRAKLVKSGTTAEWCSRTKPRCICGICSKCLRSN